MPSSALPPLSRAACGIHDDTENRHKCQYRHIAPPPHHNLFVGATFCRVGRRLRIGVASHIASFYAELHIGSFTSRGSRFLWFTTSCRLWLLRGNAFLRLGRALRQVEPCAAIWAKFKPRSRQFLSALRTKPHLVGERTCGLVPPCLISVNLYFRQTLWAHKHSMPGFKRLGRNVNSLSAMWAIKLHSTTHFSLSQSYLKFRNSMEKSAQKTSRRRHRQKKGIEPHGQIPFQNLNMRKIFTVSLIIGFFSKTIHNGLDG